MIDKHLAKELNELDNKVMETGMKYHTNREQILHMDGTIGSTDNRPAFSTSGFFQTVGALGGASVTFSSGAQRSEKKLPYWRLGRRAMQEWAKRFAKGEKYDEARNMTHNWKLAIDSEDVIFIRQFFDHALEHLFNAKESASAGGTADHENETMMDHLGAAMWNVAALIEYMDKNPDLVCKALSQHPEPINEK